MRPEESHVDPEQGSPATGSPDSPSVPLPIVLRVPWFPQETPAPSVAALPQDAAPPLEPMALTSTTASASTPAWREPSSPRRRWPVVAALAGCLCAIAVGAVVDEFWWSRPDVVRPQVRRASTIKKHTAPSTPAPAAEIEPLLANPSAHRTETVSVSAPVRPVTLAPEIIPIESGEEP